METKDDYSEAWNAQPSDSGDESAAAKRLQALRDQSNASSAQLAEEFETAYQAANQDPKP